MIDPQANLAKRREAEELRSRLRQLEQEIEAEPAPEAEGPWPPRSYYLAYHVLAGFVLGMFGAAVSLLFNIVGSLIVHQSPLRLIEIYLTFPLGKSWHDAVMSGEELPGLTLAIGCCLYLAGGMLLGIPFQLVLSRWFAGATFGVRVAVVSALGVALWLFMYYGLLSWLQPLLFGGRWIVDLIPWWVALTTHLVFAWTMVLVQPLGTFMARPNPTPETR